MSIISMEVMQVLFSCDVARLTSHSGVTSHSKI